MNAIPPLGSSPAAVPSPAAANASPLWLCWTNNCRGKLDYALYVLHVATDTGGKTLCGCRIQEFGERLTAENGPSCRRCSAILAKRHTSPVPQLP